MSESTKHPMITAFVLVLAVCLVTGLGLIIYHLAHAPVGVETSEGFEVLTASTISNRNSNSSPSVGTTPTSAHP